MNLNHAGKLMETIWHETIDEYQSVKSDKYVIMPNHFHCIISISRADMESAPTVSGIIQSFKRNTTIRYIDGVKSGIYLPFDKRIWQRSYHDRIIRNEAEYQEIWRYIDENPMKWQGDRYFKEFTLGV